MEAKAAKKKKKAEKKKLKKQAKKIAKTDETNEEVKGYTLEESKLSIKELALPENSRMASSKDASDSFSMVSEDNSVSSESFTQIKDTSDEHSRPFNKNYNPNNSSF
eukprot:TRINITY_DN930_c0_g1_i2.p2 TRINITY_DN930_c0_g1~~TRINITY_DN930_c0_g1_i2.p2  ORF type:complete len:116 (-),score=29.12 TRINITY_DN930_c0_g1_i2:111-431(-)